MQYSINQIIKKSLSLITVLFVFFQLSAYDGMMLGEKKLRVAKTLWFDIIYPERCEETAAVLYAKADQIYFEVAEQYGLEPSFRMPVVITPAVEQFNAFWTAVPYNHIAIYDTGASGSSDLAVFSETLLSTFRHELTHAVTYNMKSGFWRGVGKVFGDCIAPGMVSVTTGMAEGATVTSESAGGEGRLNDEYAKHYVKQAKIENEFPAYHDVSGASDAQPGGAAYYFNGAFHQWLQEKYGMDCYAEFWYRVVNFKNLTIAGAFKKSFKIKLKDAWKEFLSDYSVPKLDANPVYSGQVKDFFEPDGKNYSSLNNAGSLYDSLTTARGRLVWLDYYGGRVFVSDGYSEKGLSYRKLFAMSGLSGVRLSNDGRFLTVCYNSSNSANPKARVQIYDFERKSFYSLKQTGLKDAVVVQSGKDWYLIGQKYFAQHYSIVIYKIDMTDATASGNRISAVNQLVKEIEFDAEINPFAFTPLDDGTFAYIKKKGLRYSLCICTVDGSPVKEYAFAEGKAVRSLSYSNGAFYFSYAQKGSMPRLGKLEVESGKVYLSTRDFSGGVFNPVLWDGKIVYTGEFYRQSRILCMDDIHGGFGEGGYQTGRSGHELGRVDYQNVSDEMLEIEAGAEVEYTAGSIPSKSYIPFSYLNRGILVPFSTYKTARFGSDGEKKDGGLLDNYYLGTSYITGNPWTSGANGVFTLTTGWNTVTNSLGSMLSLTSGTETGLLRCKTDFKSDWNINSENHNGWNIAGINSEISSTIMVGKISSISLENTAQFFLNYKNYYYLLDLATLQYSTIHRYGPGRFERAGFAVAAIWGRWYEALLEKPWDNTYDVIALAGAAKICIPRLLPFESEYGYTQNLPVTLSFELIPPEPIYGYAYLGKDFNVKTLGRVVFDATAEVTAFAMEIQKAVPGFTALYLNDFYTNVGYACSGAAGDVSRGGFQTSKLGEYFRAVGDGTGYYLDSVYVKLGLEFTPNIGMFANPGYRMSVYGVGSYTLNSVKELKPEERLKLTFGFAMNY